MPTADAPSAAPRRRWSAALDVVLVLLCYLDGFANQLPGWNRPFVLSVLALVAVAGRRWSPGAAFLLGAPALGWAQSFLAPGVLAFSLAAREPRGRRVVVLLAVGLVVAARPVLDPDPALWRADVAAVLQLVAVLGGAAALGALVRVRRSLRARVEDLREARHREGALVDAAARAEERAAIAREMHDVVSHQVSLIALTAGALRVGDHGAPVTRAAEEIRRLAVLTTDELRTMLLTLRGADDVPAQGTTAGLQGVRTLWLAADREGDCHVQEDLVGRVPRAVQHEVYRVVQEATTNVHRHAPGTRFDVRVTGTKTGGVAVSVRNGPPAEAPSASGALRGAGHGLLGMRERVELLGGTFHAGPTADGGFAVEALIPLSAPRPDPVG